MSSAESPTRASAPAPIAADGWWTPELRAELEAVYRDTDREIAATGAVCWTRGLCCDFEKCDHVLYASSIEVAYVRELRPGPFEPESALCPFWEDGLCRLRERRPLGCRTYFCDVRHRDALEAIYEKHYRRIREIADRHGAPWEYAPFVTGLRRRGGDPGGAIFVEKRPRSS